MKAKQYIVALAVNIAIIAAIVAVSLSSRQDREPHMPSVRIGNRVELKTGSSDVSDRTTPSPKANAASNPETNRQPDTTDRPVDSENAGLEAKRNLDVVEKDPKPNLEASRSGVTSAYLRIGNHTVLPGGEASVAVFLSATSELSNLRFSLVCADSALRVSSITVTEPMTRVKTFTVPGSGRTSATVEFEEPRLFVEERQLMRIRLTASEEAKSGTIIPLSVTSASATGKDGAEIDVEYTNGLLRISGTPNGGNEVTVQTDIEPAAADTPPGMSSVPSPTKSNRGVTATPVPTLMPEGTLSPYTPIDEKETPTPVRTGSFDRFLTVLNSSAQPGETVELPVSINDMEGIQGAQFRVSYDPSLLTFKKQRKGEGFEDFIAMHNRKNNVGIVVMAGVGIATPEGPGVLSYLQFTVSSDAQAGDSCVVGLFDVIVADGSGRLESFSNDGLFQVIEDIPASTPTKVSPTPSNTSTATPSLDRRSVR